MAKKARKKRAARSKSSSAKRSVSSKKLTLLSTLSGVFVITFLMLLVVWGVKTLSKLITSVQDGHYGDVLALKEDKMEVRGEEKDDKILFTISIMADSENDFKNLEKAVRLSEELNVDYIVFLGDYTSWGDFDSLIQARNIMESGRTPYVSVPGDHDLAASVNTGDFSGSRNFSQVFGNNFHILSFQNRKMVVLDNSANYTKIPEDLISLFHSELDDAEFVFLSQPLYYPYSSIVMGFVDGVEVPDVRTQALGLLEKIRMSSVKVVFSADQHLFSRHSDPIRENLEHIVIGAINSDRNLQSPRFCLLHLFESGGYEIEEVVM